MGLAASQTRFLCLTARKSNIEFQGQQINQQRTVLANQSADLYNRMLDLSVPVPPSMTSGEYYNVSQEFFDPEHGTSGINKQLIGTPSIDYDATDGFAFKFNTLYQENGVEKTGSITTNYTTLTSINTQLSALSLPTITVADPSDMTDDEKTDVQQALIAIGIMSVDNETGSVIKSVQLDLDGDHTYDGDASNENITESDFAFGTHFDDDGYDDAMRVYEYDKFVYEKAMEDINAETESIYQKDKTLELKLKQLDSEHSAVQTEIDAVKSVIKKNVETTFKTFGS